MTRKNVLLDVSVLEILERMENDKENGYDFIVGVLRYGLKGIVPDFKEKSLEYPFIPIKDKIDFNQARYDRCVENGKKGGAKKGNQNARKQPRNNQETTNDFEGKIPNKNNQETTKKQPRNNLTDTVTDTVTVTDNDTITTNNLNSLKENNSQNINTQLLKESLEVVFREILKKNDNRKWITDSPTFEISLYKNKEFREWVSSTNCDNEELKKIWDKFRVNYLSRVSGTKEEDEIPNIEIEDNSKNVETKKGNAPVEEVIDVSQGTNKEIYDYLKENKSQGLFKGTFYVACCHNSRGLGDWMYENGYDKKIVEKIFNQIDREAKVSR